tara:strand:+ start:10587 stop:12761 length:2175 start_codon:yes stop_codon:yes gene_type:complete
MNMRQKIHEIIEKVKAVLPEFEVREGQLQFLDATADMCQSKEYPNHIIAELPTGTGKSLGGLIPAIAYVMVTNEKRSKDDTIKPVYSTATVGLQKQLERDVELLNKAGVNIKAHIVVGRSRFICKRSAQAIVRPDSEQANLLAPSAITSDQDSALGLDIPDNQSTSEVEKTKIKKALKQLGDELWSGIVDDLDRELTMENSTWRKVRAEATTCNRQCPHWGSGCPFVKNRMDTEGADLIITNHAMVFADLEKSNILPAPERAYHILDEAHHLVSNFHATMERKLSFSGLYETCARHAGSIATGIAVAADIAGLKNCSNEVNNGLTHVRNALIPLMEFLDERYQQYASTLPERERGTAIWRLDLNYIKQSGMLNGLHDIYEELVRIRAKFSSVIEGVNDSDTELNPDEAQIINSLSQHHSTIDGACELISLYIEAKETNAMWYKRHKAQGSASATLFGAQINVADDMKRDFWDRVHKSVSMSATLSNDGCFSSFNHESGLKHPQAAEYRFDSPFVEAFKYSTLHLYPNFPEPDWRNESAHSHAIVSEINRFMSYHRAGLLLFVSRRQLNEVVSLLPQSLRDVTMVQGEDGSRPTIIAEHRKKIDKGETSLLIGLASFSEGLDLKQDYLTFVGIAKLAFGAFNEPRKMTEAEQIQANGGNPFMQLTLPVAEIALQQSVGRLIRSIQCRGEVALFDRRILTKNYGAGLLNRLPPFFREYHYPERRYG